MKKLFIAMALVCAAAVQVNAQDLYKKVYNNALAVVNSAKSSDEQIQINHFKVTALNYISTQSKKRMLHKDDSFFFDSQAVNLTSFVTDFETYLIKARSISTAKRLEVIKIYQEASLHNPLFNDTDKERANCYISDKSSLTPFSLDTNWEKAYDEATAKIKTLGIK